MLKLVISDLHLSMGQVRGQHNPYEDFIYDEELCSFIDHYSTGKYEYQEVELILNGDILDPLAVEVNGGFPDRISSGVAVLKVGRCLEGHAKVVASLRAFLARPQKTVTYVMGNHDLEVAFPAVQALIRSAFGDDASSGKLRFRVFEPWYDLAGGVRVCHGNNYESLNRVNMKHLFISNGYSEPILNLPWGSIFLLKVLLPIKAQRPHITHVHPFSRYLALAMLSDTGVALPATVRATYYFMKTRFLEAQKRSAGLGDTLRILRDEAVVSPDLQDAATAMMKEEPGLTAVIMGHSHEAKVRAIGNRGIYINTGTWTKYVSLDLPDFGAHTRLTYAKVEYGERGSVPVVGLYEWFGEHELFRERKF